MYDSGPDRANSQRLPKETPWLLLVNTLVGVLIAAAYASGGSMIAVPWAAVAGFSAGVTVAAWGILD